MPFWDRFWWLRSLLALALDAATAFAAVRIWLAPGDFGLDLGDLPARVALAVAILGLLALWAVGIWRAGLLALRRKRLRLAAIAGPPPLLPAISSLPLDMPIELLWRRSLSGIVVSLFGGYIIIIYWLARALTLAVPPLLGSRMPDHLSDQFSDALAQLPPPLVPVAALFALAALWWVSRRPWGIVAQEDGLILRRRFGRAWHMRWDEPRLLEQRYEGRGLDWSQTYILYSSQGTGRWAIDAGRLHDITPMGITIEEQQWRFEDMLAVLRERAGLVPRRIDIEAANPGEERHGGLLALDVAEKYALLPLMALGFGALLVFAPLSSDATVNWVVGISLPIASALATVPLALGWLVQRLRSIETRMLPTSVCEELPEPPGWVYEVHTEMRWDTRVSYLLFGLVGLVALVPAPALWFPGQLNSILPHWQVTIEDGFSTIAAYILLCWGIVAVLMLLAAFFTRSLTIRADATGLTELHGHQVKAHIAWDDLQRLSPSTLHSRPSSYQAKGNQRRPLIQWSAGSMGGRSPRFGPQSVTPAQLFALAAKHSGVVPDAPDTGNLPLAHQADQFSPETAEEA